MKIPGILKNYKIIGIVVILIVLGVVFRNQIQSKISPEPEFKTATVKKESLIQTISASGKVKSDEEAVLKFQTSGYLAWVGVQKGDQVKKWQAVASLDKEALQKQLKQELIDYMNERWDFEQTQDDYHTEDNPPEKVSLNNEMLRILQQAQFDLDRNILDVEILNLTIKYATLWSPIEGIVTDLDAPNAGVNITPATASFTISNPDKMVFSAKVDESDIGNIQPGMKAEITLDSYPDEKIQTTIEYIDFTATTTSSGGTAYEIKLKLPENNSQRFRIGMNGDAEITVSQKENVLTVPFEAVQEKEGQNYVWVVPQEDSPVKRDIKIGLGNDSDTEIIEGVSEGEKVVTSNFKLLNSSGN